MNTRCLQPLVLLLFARPDTTAKVWAAVRRARPRRLLVVADAARPGRPDEARRVAEVRALIRPDWPCRVSRLYATENMGCGRRISSGLDWVFSQVSEASILEDDCVPHPDWFAWSRAMLAAHRRHETVMSVGGSVGAGMEAPAPHLSRYHFIWGWSTWRRAWSHRDQSMRAWPAVARSDFLLRALGGDRRAAAYWRETFWDVYEGRSDSWAIPWFFACLRRGGLSLVPARNCVTNIGVDNATHPGRDTRNLELRGRPLKARDLVLGAAAEPDPEWDARFERCYYSGAERGQWKRPLRRRLRWCFKRLGWR
jgi:hypothetical protein